MHLQSQDLSYSFSPCPQFLLYPLVLVTPLGAFNSSQLGCHILRAILSKWPPSCCLCFTYSSDKGDPYLWRIFYLYLYVSPIPSISRSPHFEVLLRPSPSLETTRGDLDHHYPRMISCILKVNWKSTSSKGIGRQDMRHLALFTPSPQEFCMCMSWNSREFLSLHQATTSITSFPAAQDTSPSPFPPTSAGAT